MSISSPGHLDRRDADVHERADRALRENRPAEALPLYLSLLRHVGVTAPGAYDRWLDGALAAFQALGRTREAGCVLLALRRFGDAERCFDPQKQPHEWALCAANQGRHREAARAWSVSGHGALGALALERGGDWAGARQAWEALLADDRLRGRPYEAALVRFNLGQTLRRLGQGAEARRELTLTARALEELADGYEIAGESDRAFDCYGLLLRIGKDGGSFENVCEGYLNAIRLLAASGYRHETVLEYYEDFIAYAGSVEEWQAGALLADEAAGFSIRRGLVFERHYRQRAAALWREAAQQNARRGGPEEVTESALVAAVEASAAAGDLPAVGAIYGALAQLALPEARRQRYATLARRTANAAESPPPQPGLPEHLRQSVAYAEIWRHDLVDWDLAGDPAGVLAQIVVDRLGVLACERQALRALLACADPRYSPDDVGATAELARMLGKIQAYEVLPPLERLAVHPMAAVRAAALTGAGQVPQTRSFAMVRRGLADADETVRVEARRALRCLGFPSGLASLVRLYREAKDDRVRQAAVEAIADVGRLDAGLFLMNLVREAPGAIGALAAKRLRAFNCPELWPVVRHYAELERGPARATLESLAATVGA